MIVVRWLLYLVYSIPLLAVSADNVIAPPKDWIMGDLLGGGSFGQVFVCHDRDDGRTMAVKQVTIYMGSRASTEVCLLDNHKQFAL
jgi:hypothetical protein